MRFNDMEEAFTGFMCRVTICEQITKNWNRLQMDIQTMNDEITVIF